MAHDLPIAKQKRAPPARVSDAITQSDDWAKNLPSDNGVDLNSSQDSVRLLMGKLDGYERAVPQPHRVDSLRDYHHNLGKIA